VRWARQHDIEAAGIDMAAPHEDADLVRADLCEPIDLGRQFQWVLCWEVAEHLPAAAADVLCHTLVHHMKPGGRILWTAARPGQRGPGHINCQPSSYWIDKFAALGLVVAEGERLRLRLAWLRASPKTPWYGNNVQVFWRVV
jgi:2-polyprenyl-3-methyl-5-hydroxy-6-metoxy-1,4-benzoquinol methylase